MDIEEGTIQGRNEVFLVGRISAKAEERVLPSGDVLLTWKLVVDRPATKRPVPADRRVATIDTLACTAWQPTLRKSAAAWQPGDIVQVEGSLQRRFWKTPNGPGSLYEVMVTKAKRLAKAA